MENNEALATILKKSHSQALAGQTFTMNQVNIFMKNKIDELTSQVDRYCIAESV